MTKQLIKELTKTVVKSGVQDFDADDIVQDCLISFIETDGDVMMAKSDIGKYIARFKAAERRNRNINTIYNDEYITHLKKEKSKLIINFDECNEYQADIIQMRQNNLEFKDIAELLGKSVDAVRQQYHRSVQKLKDNTKK